MTLPFAVWAGLLLSVVGNVWLLFLAYSVDPQRARLSLLRPYRNSLWVISKMPKHAAVPAALFCFGLLLFLCGIMQMLPPTMQ